MRLHDNARIAQECMRKIALDLQDYTRLHEIAGNWKQLHKIKGITQNCIRMY